MTASVVKLRDTGAIGLKMDAFARCGEGRRGAADVARWAKRHFGHIDPEQVAKAHIQEQ